MLGSIFESGTIDLLHAAILAAFIGFLSTSCPFPVELAQVMSDLLALTALVTAFD